MTEPQLRFVQCAHPGGLHRMAYWQWGEPDNPRVVVCVHGLTRSGRDMDALAQALAPHYRVICPDIVGRGRSDWLDQPSLYQVPLYVADCVTLIARLDVEAVGWVGTSMGGLIGMLLAATAGSPIRALVLNDVGPELEASGLDRIRTYVGRDPVFESEEAGAAEVRRLSSAFGNLTDEQWSLLTRHHVVRRDGQWRLHYDPRIAEVVLASAAAGPVDLWPFYDRIPVPTLVMRGEHSDLLSATVAERMTQRGPRARLETVAGVGHAPSLIPDEQVALVKSFLLSSAWS